jgi:hypothetical protein
MLDGMHAPDVIVVSKRDIYDAQGALADYVTSKGFVLRETYQAFKIYERPPRQLPPPAVERRRLRATHRRC